MQKHNRLIFATTMLVLISLILAACGGSGTAPAASESANAAAMVRFI